MVDTGFFLVDVFGTEPFSGNPLPVVIGGSIVIKGHAITRLDRKGNPSNSKAAMNFVAEEEGFEPPRPFRV